MFDLNLPIDSNDDDKFNTNANNYDGGGESTSSNDGTCSIRATSSSFNLDRNDLNSDRGLTSTESTRLVTRDLFPLSRLDRGRLAVQQVQAVQARKSRRGPRSRSSQYRGVTFYRRTGRWESHIWDCGKQVYLGGFDTALAAARAYDRAAIKFRGVEADINFNLSDYDDMKQMMDLSKEEFVQLLRRGSCGFSKYRGVTLYKCGLGKNNGSDAVATYSGYGYGGSRHHLNLDLGMPESSIKDGESKLHHAQTTKTVKLHALEGVQYPIFRIGVDPNNEERETNLGCHVPTNSNTTLATAASSGFLSPPPSASASPNTLPSYSWMNPFSPTSYYSLFNI